MKNHQTLLIGTSLKKNGYSVRIQWVLVISVILLTFVAVFWHLDHKSGVPVTPVSKEGPIVRTLRLGLNIASGSALHAAAEQFSDLIYKRSDGKLKVRVYPDQQLGNDAQMVEMARNGELDLILTPTAKLSSAIPAMQYADLPFYFSSREELYTMLDGEPGQILLSKLNAIDLVGLTFWENGFKQFTANTLLQTPKDFKHLRFRTMKSRLIMDQFIALGAQPIPIDFHATYKALADGAVDGQENPLVAIVAMGFHKVQKHLTLSNHAYLGYVFSASRKVFETLPPDMRNIIQTTANELTLWERKETARREMGFLETIRAAGVAIHTLTPEERQQFSAILAPMVDSFGFQVGYDLLAKTEELRYARQSATPESRKEDLLIGLDVDLSQGGAQAGGAIFRGVQMAIEEINHEGGLLGSQFRVLALNNGANPDAGHRNLQRFAALPSLLAVMGGIHTPVVMAELDDIHLLRIPYLIPWASGEELTDHSHRPSYTFRVSIKDSRIEPFLLENALKMGGHVAILLEESASGRSTESLLKPVIDKLPANSVTISRFYASEIDFDTKIKTLVQGGSKALIIVADHPGTRAFVQAMAHQNNPVPIFANWRLTGSDFWNQEQTALKRVDLRFVQSFLLDEVNTGAGLQKFTRQYRQRYGLGAYDSLPSPAGSVHAYDLIHLLALAVKQANTTDRVLIREALENLPPYPGLMKNYNPAFTPGHHDALEGLPLFMARFDEQGRIVREE